MLQTLLKGALTGTVGAFAMTVALRRVFPVLLPREFQREEFLPKKVIEGLEAKTVGPGALSDEQEMDVTMPVHYGYGTTAGVVYGLVRERLDGRSPAVLGALYGLALWAISYEGWLPAAGILEATTERPPREWPVPILAHLVYGTTTALAYEALSRW